MERRTSTSTSTYSPYRRKKGGYSNMIDLVGAFEENAFTIEDEKKKPEGLKIDQVTARDQTHLEMASEWLERKTNKSRFYPSTALGERGILANKEAIGRNWQHLELAYEWLKIREKIMPLILKRRIWWEPVDEATSYVVYVSKDRTIFEPTQFLRVATQGIISKEVTGKIELIIPDEWPEFPMEPGTYHIGVTVRDCVGNESDPLLLVGQFKFFAPPAPMRGGVETL
jgi:hypothetical protein